MSKACAISSWGIILLVRIESCNLYSQLVLSKVKVKTTKHDNDKLFHKCMAHMINLTFALNLDESYDENFYSCRE